jgi:hypothetical protein
MTNKRGVVSLLVASTACPWSAVTYANDIQTRLAAEQWPHG